ncbi:hypothetical protein HMPREF9441_02757 [Paraprevotella clara YIT 11840]|uniref:Uncharacterized protein n=1 Tax=Paraprevotella clara YIT 11840 TaxID=762968 RepID=G5STQ2_9BACT|nr:hypothetical protein HMPREF9441_02757 [Paraprevotella clara YIT 11840]
MVYAKCSSFATIRIHHFLIAKFLFLDIFITKNMFRLTNKFNPS